MSNVDQPTHWKSTQKPNTVSTIDLKLYVGACALADCCRLLDSTEVRLIQTIISHPVESMMTGAIYSLSFSPSTEGTPVS